MDTTDHLSQFNRQVLQCQDDAYTLAWYLLGDETEAEAVMQEAVEMTFRCFSPCHADCRLLILTQVVHLFRGRKPTAYGFEEPDVLPDLRFLPEPDRIVLVLIDILGISYTDASHITGTSLIETGWLLSQARRRMIKTSSTIERGGR